MATTKWYGDQVDATKTEPKYETWKTDTYSTFWTVTKYKMCTEPKYKTLFVLFRQQQNVRCNFWHVRI